MSSYITIDGWRSNIRFSCAHIIHEYEKCGRLHGHTYAIHVKITGKKDKKGIILDFSQLKNTLRDIANELDHHLLIPKKSKIAKITKRDENVELIALEKEFIVPLEDCVFLPIESTSAENLAEFVLEELLRRIKFPNTIENVEIGVDEGYGQGAKVNKNFK